MRHRLALVLAVIGCFGIVGVSSASATAEYFYKENILGEWQSVSGVPHPDLYMVAAYTNNTEAVYCVRAPESIYVNQVCGQDTKSVQTTLPTPEYGRGELEHHTFGGAARFTAEERFS